MVKTHNVLSHARDKYKNISIINPLAPPWLHSKQKNSKCIIHLHYKWDTDDSHLAACSGSFIPHIKEHLLISSSFVKCYVLRLCFFSDTIYCWSFLCTISHACLDFFFNSCIHCTVFYISHFLSNQANDIPELLSENMLLKICNCSI